MSLSRADYPLVERLAHEARALWHDLGNTGEEGFALFTLGFVARLRGDFPTARALLEEGLALCRAGGHGAGETNCLWSLAELASDLGDDREARVWAESALARTTEVGWTIGVAVARRVLGAVHARRGEYGAAAVLLEASLAEARALGARWWIAETLAQLGQLALAQGDPGLATTRFGESLALARDLADRAGMARVLEGVAQLAVLRRAPRQALQLAGAAASLRETMRAPLTTRDRAQLEHRLAPARRTLGEPAAEAAWAEGGALVAERAIDLALAHVQPEARTRSATPGHTTLTERELAVTRLVAQGLTNRQIAEHLVIAEGTAERHVGNILAKLDMSSRSQLGAWAVTVHGHEPCGQRRSLRAGGRRARVSRAPSPHSSRGRHQRAPVPARTARRFSVWFAPPVPASRSRHCRHAPSKRPSSRSGAAERRRPGTITWPLCARLSRCCVCRKEELAFLHTFTADVRQGPAVLVLEGEAGIGKSTLWLAGVSHARMQGGRTLSSRPAEAERSLAHVGLTDLFEPVLDEVLPALTPPRRRALEIVLL